MKYEEIADIESPSSSVNEAMMHASLVTLRHRVMDRVSQTTSKEDLYECLNVLSHENDRSISDIDNYCPYSTPELNTRMDLAEKMISDGKCSPVETLLNKYRTKYHF